MNFKWKIVDINMNLISLIKSVPSLQEVARIAFRLGIGGVHFAARVARHPKMPERLRKYVLCSGELSVISVPDSKSDADIFDVPEASDT